MGLCLSPIVMSYTLVVTIPSAALIQGGFQEKGLILGSFRFSRHVFLISHPGDPNGKQTMEAHRDVRCQGSHIF
jgi:hypothetical protein